MPSNAMVDSGGFSYTPNVAVVPSEVAGGNGRFNATVFVF